MAKAEVKEVIKPIVFAFKLSDDSYHIFQIKNWRAQAENKIRKDFEDPSKMMCDCVMCSFDGKCPHMQLLNPITKMARNRDKWWAIDPTYLEVGMIAVIDFNKSEDGELAIIDPTLPNISGFTLVKELVTNPTILLDSKDGVFNPNRIYTECVKSISDGASFADGGVKKVGLEVKPFILPDHIRGLVDFDISKESTTTVVGPPSDVKVDVPIKEVRRKTWVSTPRPNPFDFYVKDDDWKTILYCMDNEENILLVGPSGSGKSEVLYVAAAALGRNIEAFNMGAMSEPRLSLIGATHFSRHKVESTPERIKEDIEKEGGEEKETEKVVGSAGTWFKPSRFVRSIMTPHHVILLDEVSRAVQAANNILLPLMDRQGYLSLDESEDAGIVKRAEGVMFAGTANIGMQFTGTEELDSAYQQRFGFVVDIDFPPQENEINLLMHRCSGIGRSQARDLVDIANKQRELAKNGDFQNGISTRMLLSAAKAVSRGLPVSLAIKSCIENQFKADGGDDSERANIRKIVQKGGKV